MSRILRKDATALLVLWRPESQATTVVDARERPAHPYGGVLQVDDELA